ncbi:protein of unknown function [Rhodovastum atsumiense]|nr:protein of unknown function [Rhodovastum atsumiense]
MLTEWILFHPGLVGSKSHEARGQSFGSSSGEAMRPTKTQLSGSIGAPAFPPRPGSALATARSEGDGRREAARSHAQRSEHGEHRTFPAASTVAGSALVGGAQHPAHPPSAQPG